MFMISILPKVQLLSTQSRSYRAFRPKVQLLQIAQKIAKCNHAMFT